MAEQQDVLDRERAINLLRSYKDRFAERYGVVSIGLFGSLARNQATETSDVDVVVQLLNPDLFTLVHIREDLETTFHRHVDIVQYREKMNPYLKKRIEQDAVYV